MVFSFFLAYNTYMIRVAILEYEKETKDIIFELSKAFMEIDWTFRHYRKASDLNRAMKNEEYHLFIFDEMFKTARLESVFVHDNPNAFFIYVCQDAAKTRQDDQRTRVLYIEKDHLVEDLKKYEALIVAQCSQIDLYSLSYDGVHVNFAYEDIYYLEKVDKMVFFHTKKGKFHKRMNMSDLETIFEPYGFLRVHVSYLVNAKHIVAWFKDEVLLATQERIPLSRAQKRKLSSQMKENRPRIPE